MTSPIVDTENPVEALKALTELYRCLAQLGHSQKDVDLICKVQECIDALVTTKRFRR